MGCPRQLFVVFGIPRWCGTIGLAGAARHTAWGKSSHPRPVVRTEPLNGGQLGDDVPSPGRKAWQVGQCLATGLCASGNSSGKSAFAAGEQLIVQTGDRRPMRVMPWLA
eukprot:3426562-Alexandrium_andersonii.AAC.1